MHVCDLGYTLNFHLFLGIYIIEMLNNFCDSFFILSLHTFNNVTFYFSIQNSDD